MLVGDSPSSFPHSRPLDILHHKQAKLRKDMQHSEGNLIFFFFQVQIKILENVPKNTMKQFTKESYLHKSNWSKLSV